jgi:predicted Fe-Mo cluster-binding NifX family protein
MRIALPEFNGRISPVFDFCRRLLVVDIDPMGRSEKFTVDWSETPLAERARELLDLKVEALLCGGISCDLSADVARRGIRVFPWISGEIPEVISAFLADRLPDPGFTMPGCPRGPGPHEGWPRGWGTCRRRGPAGRWK